MTGDRGRGIAAILRPERPGEARAIGRLIDEAFLTAAHASGTEAAIVEALRSDGALTLSLVAEGPEGLRGHIAASPVAVGGEGGWAGIGPLAVLAPWRRQGVGARLMEAALADLRERGFRGAVLVGDPAWYRRFGFAARPGLTVPGIPGAFVLGLGFGAEVPSGPVAFHGAFGVA